MAAAFERDETRTGDCGGQPAPFLKGLRRLAAAVQDEGGDPHARQKTIDVEGVTDRRMFAALSGEAVFCCSSLKAADVSSMAHGFESRGQGAAASLAGCYSHPPRLPGRLGRSIGPLLGTAEKGEARRMALKAPGILIFLLSIVLALAVLFAKFFDATVPLLGREVQQFYGLLLAYVILVLGCIMRGL